MNKRNHPSAVAARTELCAHGFVTVHVPPGAPEQWGKPKDKRRFAIQREDRARSARYHIIDYPPPEFAWMDGA